MKRKDVYHWLGGIDSQTSSTPHSFSLRNDNVDLDTPSLPTAPTDRSSSGSSHQTSHIRELLNKLPHSTQSIHYARPRSVQLPEKVLSLRRTLCQNFGSNVVPMELKEHINQANPEEALDIPDSAYDSSRKWSSEQFESMWEDVNDVFQAAAECDEYGQDENAWCSEVVQMILKRGTKLRSGMQVKNAQGQEVSPSLLPHIPGQTKIGRAVDYTFTFPIRKQRVKKTYNQIAFLQPNQTISHTTDPFTKRIALFSGIKVKESNGDNKEALLQLTIWLSAGLEKLQRLGNSRNKELDGSQLLPTIGWTVIGHDWHLYIGFRGTFERQDKIYIEGPIDGVAASTRTYYGVFKLLDLIGRVSAYAEAVYWPWLCDEILEC